MYNEAPVIACNSGGPKVNHYTSHRNQLSMRKQDFSVRVEQTHGVIECFNCTEMRSWDPDLVQTERRELFSFSGSMPFSDQSANTCPRFALQKREKVNEL